MRNPHYLGTCSGSGPRHHTAGAGSLAAWARRQRTQLVITLGLGCLSAAGPVAAQSAAPRPAVAAPRSGGGVAAAVPAVAPVMRLTALRGDVQRRHAGGAAEAVTAGALPLTLAKGDELAVLSGAAELSLDSGMQVLVPEGSAVSVLGVSSVGLLRGELQIVPKPGKEPRPMYVQGPPGSFPLKVREALVRRDGDALVVMVYDGVARPGSATISFGPAVNTGQAARWAKGAPPPAARPLLPAPAWSTTGELFLQGATPLPISTRWQPVPGAQRYRVEVLRSDGDNPPVLVSTNEVGSGRTSVDLHGIDPGSYLTRVSAIDELGAIGVPSVPRQLLVTQVSNLEADGVVRALAGSQPQVTAAPGQPATVLVDGEPPPASGLTPGTHRLRIVVGGLSAEAPLVVPVPAPPVNAPAERSAPPISERTAPLIEPREVEPPRPLPPPLPPPLPLPVSTPPLRIAVPPPPVVPVWAGPEDLLLGGIGEVPFDGLRSPWAGRMVTLRVESTFSGAARLALSGRLVMNNGFGVDLSASLLRTALTDVPEGTAATTFGNVSAALRSPALRKGRFALQGLIAGVAPISTSVLDTSVEVDSSFAAPSSSFRPDVRPPGGGWRVEPAVLFGFRFGQFAVFTTQGASLRLTPEFSAAYAGGLVIHAEVLPLLRFMTFAQWEVGYLGAALAADDSGPDAGGAAGAGFEVLLPGGKAGQFRLELLGRTGIGNVGVAIYGRGTLGLQVGYRFR